MSVLTRLICLGKAAHYLYANGAKNGAPAGFCHRDT